MLPVCGDEPEAHIIVRIGTAVCSLYVGMSLILTYAPHSLTRMLPVCGDEPGVMLGTEAAARYAPCMWG